MRLVWLIAVLLCAPLRAAENAGPWPLWDGKETVAEYAKRVNLPPARSFDLGGGVTLDLVLIPAGQFMMGSPEPLPPTISWRWAGVMGLCGLILAAALLCVPLVNWIKVRRFSFSLRVLVLFTTACGLCLGGVTRFHLGKEQEVNYAVALSTYRKIPVIYEPARIATIPNPFYMGKYTVTQAQYEIISGNNPSPQKGAQLPVDMVSYSDANDHCAKLTDKLKALLNAEVTFQLPTEAQWEFACRAGSTTAFNTGDTISTDEANFDGRETSVFTRTPCIYRGKAMPVGSFKSNAFGLYDMHGNVGQWCVDIREYNQECLFAVRGGCWNCYAQASRSANRGGAPLQHSGIAIGFRVILTVPPPAKR